MTRYRVTTEDLRGWTLGACYVVATSPEAAAAMEAAYHLSMYRDVARVRVVPA